MLVTLLSFIAGSVVGAAHMPWWEKTPALKPISLVARFGTVPALAMSLTAFGLIAFATVMIERRRTGLSGRSEDRHYDALRGPWPLVAGALGSRSSTSRRSSWRGAPGRHVGVRAVGSKAIAAAGVNVASWPYWTPAARAAELKASVVRDITSVMDAGIILGALVAAGLAGRFAPAWRVPARSLLAAVIGGLFLGYGARIAYGCNIGAYFSGIASASVHGWLWLVAAFAGSVLGTSLRPLFGLRVERTAEAGKRVL